MVLLEDKNQKIEKHSAKHEYWEKDGIEVNREHRLPIGDYVFMNDKIQDMIDRKEKRGMKPSMMDFLGTYDCVVDTKYGMQEIYSDIIGKDHERFRDSCMLALNNRIRYVVLIEETGFYSIEDVAHWRNPRREKWFQVSNAKKQGKAKNVKISMKPPAPSETLMKSMMSMADKYLVEFKFCSPEEAGEKVIRILKGEE